MIEKADAGQIIKSLIVTLISLDPFSPEGSRGFQRNLKQESDVFQILCYKEEHKICWLYDLEIWMACSILRRDRPGTLENKFG